MSGTRSRPFEAGSATRSAEAFRLRPLPALPADAHKGDAGRVLCVAGSETMPGAAVLVARAAQRAGAGLVAIGCLDASLLSIVPVAAPEAVLVDLRDAFSPAGTPARGADDLWSHRDPHARLLGPGLGDVARTRAVVAATLRSASSAPLVFDADALNALAGRPEALRDVAAPVVITPHPGEARRLGGTPVPDDEPGRVELALELAARSGAIVCLKGAGTVVAHGERALVNRTGNPAMATAGTGDVLAGILVAYLAACHRDAGFTPFDAAALAVHVHGRAGDLAAARLGTRAVVASDLVGALAEAQRGFDGERPAPEA